MLNVEIKDARDATECDRCQDRGCHGCKIGTTTTEVLACRIERALERNKCLESVGDKIKYIADYYGMVNQSKIAIEEMSELTKALCKLERYPAIDYRNEQYLENAIEEIADVSIMVEQLKYLYGVDKVNGTINHKSAIAKMSKLTETLCKLVQYPDVDSRNKKYNGDVIKEILDVMDSVEHLKQQYGADAVNNMINYKIARTIEGINYKIARTFEGIKKEKGTNNIP